MAFTYNSSNIGSSSLSWVRWRIGHTSSGAIQLDDAEILAGVTEVGSKQFGAAKAAESLAGKYARFVDQGIGGTRLSMSQAFSHYMDLAKRIRAEASLGVAGYAGGLSEAERTDDASNSDLVQPRFESGQFDYAGAGTDDSTA